ncbi:hypothetical protein Goshw_003641 [Gossypium schwendimanii]|uniref:Uncharacterized protein n=1 Tax=Gossypium schwendimanii TaxID=34291 RepID=A0A7J9KJJ1_GOSSC|nr:hypothetical protein [Gossypium schwendimanii]
MQERIFMKEKKNSQLKRKRRTQEKKTRTRDPLPLIHLSHCCLKA